MVKRRNENAPLLLDEGPSFAPSRQRMFGSVYDVENPVYDGNDPNDGSQFLSHDDPRAMTQQKRSNKLLMITDIMLMILECVQYFALLQSLALRWTWPLTWTRIMSFLFLFNLDIWEFAKVIRGDYTAARESFVASSSVPISFSGWLIFWFIFLALATIFIFVLRHQLSKRVLFNEDSKLLSVVIICVQVLALPLGVQLGKVFWCLPVSNTMDVNNNVQCWSGEHIAYVVLAIVIFIAYYILYGVWLIYRIHREVVSSNARKHETYLQLKHCEYIFKLDTSWKDRLFFSFGTYTRFWAYYRPISHFFKLVIIILYAAGFSNRLVQASLVFFFFLLHLFVTLIKFPYRVTSFNIASFWCWSCLICCVVIGVFQNIEGLQSAFLLPSYIEGELILITVAWLAGMLSFIIYLVLRHTGMLCGDTPLMPNMLHKGMDGFNKNTKRYMIAAIQGRCAVKRALRFPALLAPVHELSHHIQVVNALACEAEYIEDPLHSTLRDVLEDLVDLHGKLVHHSIFTESLKVKVQSTVNKLVEVLPAFTKRLKQREFDMILATPLRRRMLLKMFAVSCFMRAKEDRPHDPGVRKLWTAPETGFAYDEGFHEEESVINLDNIELNEMQGRATASVHSYESYTFQADRIPQGSTDA